MKARRREAHPGRFSCSALLLCSIACSSPRTTEDARIATSQSELSIWTAEPAFVEGAGTDPRIQLAYDIALAVTDKHVSTYRRTPAGWIRQAGTQAVGPCDELNGPAIKHYSAAISGAVALVSENNVAGHYGPCVYLRSGDDFVAAPALEADDQTGDLTSQYAISGDTLLIASATGIAVYERRENAFVHVQMLQTSDGLTGSKPFWLAGNDAIVQSAGQLYAFERDDAAGFSETGIVDTSGTTPITSATLSTSYLMVHAGTNTGFYSKLSGAWSLDQVVTSPRGVMDSGSDVAVIDSIVYELFQGSWQQTRDLNPAVVRQPYQPPFRRPVTSVAVWDGGLLLGLNGSYMYDGLQFVTDGTVTPFDRYVEPETCTADRDCRSTHCVEGVCCDTACSGTCVSCLASRKGGGIDGVCGFVVEDTDPRDSCSAGAPDGCGQTGQCTAAGACKVEADGTPCRGGYLCADGVCGATCVDDSGCDRANGYSCVEGYCRTTIVEPAGGAGGDSGGAAGEPAMPTAGSGCESGAAAGTCGYVPARGLPRRRPSARHHSRFGGCALEGAPSPAFGWLMLGASLVMVRHGRRNPRS